MPGQGKISSAKLIAAITERRRLSLGRFLFAIGIPEVGEVASRAIASLLGRFDYVRTCPAEVLACLPSIGMGVGRVIQDFFSDQVTQKGVKDFFRPDTHFQLEETEPAREAYLCITYSRLLENLGIRKIGKTSTDLLGSKIARISDLLLPQKELTERFEDEELSGELYRYFSDEGNRARALNIDHWIELTGIRKDNAPDGSGATKSAPLLGKSFVFTGSLAKWTRDEAKHAIEQLGGKVSSSVSNRTDFVVVGQDPGGKRAQALKLGVRMINEEEFLRLLNGARTN